MNTLKINYNPFDGSELLTADEGLANLQGTIKQDPGQYLNILETMFWKVMSDNKLDSSFKENSYTLFREINAVMLASINQ